MNLITIIGLIAGAITTISQLPQAIKSFKSKSTGDLAFSMVFLLWFGVFLWLIYGIFIKDLPVILANSITFLLISITLTMKIKYK